VLLLPGAALAADYASCRASPNLVGACFSVHGRLFVANGTPSVRILRLGTNRILGVLDRQLQAESDEVTPDAVRQAAMDSLQERFYEVMPYVVTGQFLAPKAWRDNVTGIVNASEFVFWNVEKK